MYQYFSSPFQRATRADRTQHTKMDLRESSVPENKGMGWIYTGSANLSGSAWGGGLIHPDSKASQHQKQAHLSKIHKHRVNMYELGVLLSNVNMDDYKTVIPWRRQDWQTLNSEELRELEVVERR